MEKLPLDVLCYILEQYEVEAWLLRLRGVSKLFRRVVDRVAGRVLPLGLMHGGQATAVETPLPGIPGESLKAWGAVGANVLAWDTLFVRVCNTSFETLSSWTRGPCTGNGFHLQSDPPLLVCFRGAVTETPVAAAALALVASCDNSCFAADGSVWCAAEVEGRSGRVLQHVNLRTGRVVDVCAVAPDEDTEELFWWALSERAVVMAGRGPGGARCVVCRDAISGEEWSFEIGGERVCPPG
jgi:hypothetical protein